MYSSSTKDKRQNGFTLVELVVVVALIAIMMVAFGGKFDSVFGQRQRSELRRLVDVWGFLQDQAVSRGESYRLMFDVDTNSYWVLREVPLDASTVKNVDYNKNFRTRREQERLRKKATQQTGQNLKDVYAAEASRQSRSLDVQFYEQIFTDLNAEKRLEVPLEFPTLSEQQRLPDGIDIVSVEAQGQDIREGEAFIRVSSAGAMEFGVIHLKVQSQDMTMLSDPGTGRFVIENGYVDYNWKLGK